MCVKTIGAASSMLVDSAELPKARKKKKKPAKKTEDVQQTAKMNSVREERLERLAREWVPHPIYWAGDPNLVPWVFPPTPRDDG